MPRWTEEQLQAIEESGKNIIVSAGAGSGKTAVLTERVLQKLKKGIHINELLVLTFTNAAAAEMKERIRKAIAKTPNLEEELVLIDSSYITTFDSFSLSVVKKYHTNLNITNKIKITDEAVITLQKKHLIDEIMEELYQQQNQSFLNLIHNFCLKDDEELKNYILNAYNKIELKYDRVEYLNNYIEKAYSNETINKFIVEYFSLIDSYRKEIKNTLPNMNEYFDGDYMSNLELSLSKLMEAKNYNEVVTALDFKIKAVPRGTEEEGKKLKETISELVKEIKELTIYQNEEEMKQEILSTKEDTTIVINIIKELNLRLTKYKQDNEVYNFIDIAHLAISAIATHDEIRNELKSTFKEILVDEYQDTSDIQEEFLSLISQDNLYMVGDIKQSIYRFRNANPYIFKNKYDLYRDSDKGIKIDLLKNFRSRKEVLDNINLLFNLFMDDEIGGADYKESHQMVFGNNAYLEEKTDQDYNMELLTYKQPKKPITDDEEEAFIIGYDIIDKIKNKYQIFDKETGKLRDINYSDCVILLDKSKNFDLYKKIFEYLHIPLTILKDEALRKDEDILVIKNLLRLLICIKENKYEIDFKYSFISICRSFLYKITDEEIYDIYIKNKYFETELFKKCQNLVKDIDILPAPTFFYKVLEEFSYDEKLLTIGNVKSKRIRAEYFYNLIEDFSKTGNTIYDFVNYLDELFESGYDLKFSINTKENNTCQIMTIHKSKGKEYPICYFAGFKSRFNLSELKEKIVYDNKYGLILPKVNNYYKDTILKTLLKHTTKQEEISEKIRLLYVALTRAREKMIIVMKELNDDQSATDFVSTYEREKYNSFQSIIKSIYEQLIPFERKIDIEVTREYQRNITEKELVNTNKFEKIVVNENSYQDNYIEEKHFSKETLTIPSKEEKYAMEFGTKIHQVLEEISFKNPDPYLEKLPKEIEEKIKTFLNQDIIKENINSKIYKEYEFSIENETEKLHGIIDLLIENENDILIIDYKLKNINDPNYNKQLNGYREFIKTKTNKNIKCYLYSIMDGIFKEIEE